MEQRILLSVDDYETRVAVLENGLLAEYIFERADQHRMAGNIYKGRVTAIVHGIEAAFVDIGIGRNAFLFVSDVTPMFDDEFARLMGVDSEEENGEAIETEQEVVTDLPPISIGEMLREGQEIMVQMEKEPIGSKGSRVTTNISLPGKYMVLLPLTQHIGVSRRIENVEEKTRLRDLAVELCPSGMGLIVRTAAEGHNENDFARDVETLKQLWERIRHKSDHSGAPSLIHKDLGLTFRLVRDVLNDQTSEVTIDDYEAYQQLRSYSESILPGLVPRIHYWAEEVPLFTAQGIDAEISGLMNKKVWLNCGGYIVIEETEALTAIDVNTGKYLGSRNLEETVLVTNLEAAEEIARQLRLRDIGGIVIIDFIDMQKPENRLLVLKKLQDALKRDRSRTHVLEITELGLIQMTRKRVRRSLNKSLTQPCPYCKREGVILSLSTMTIKVLRRLESICRSSPVKDISLHLHPRLANHINIEQGEHIERLKKRYKKSIHIHPAPDIHFEDIKDEQAYDSASGLGVDIRGAFW